MYYSGSLTGQSQAKVAGVKIQVKSEKRVGAQTGARPRSGREQRHSCVYGATGTEVCRA